MKNPIFTSIEILEPSEAYEMQGDDSVLSFTVVGVDAAGNRYFLADFFQSRNVPCFVPHARDIALLLKYAVMRAGFIPQK